MGQLRISVKECSTTELLMTSPLVASLYIEKIGENALFGHYGQYQLCAMYIEYSIGSPKGTLYYILLIYIVY